MGSVGAKRAGAGGGSGLGPQANSPDDNQQTQTMSDADNVNWKAFQATSEDDISNALTVFANTKVDLGVNTRLQRTLQELGLNEAPTVLDDDVFDASISQNALDGVEIYRGVSGNSSMSASDMTEYFKFGDRTLVGRGIHGDGFYFSTSQRTGRIYSDYTKNSVITGYIDKSKARVVTERDLIRMYNQESSKVQSAFGGRTTGRDSALAQYALYKGYNVIHVPGGNAGGHNGSVRQSISYKNGGEDYYVPLIRSVMVVRKTSRIS